MTRGCWYHIFFHQFPDDSRNFRIPGIFFGLEEFPCFILVAIEPGAQLHERVIGTGTITLPRSRSGSIAPSVSILLRQLPAFVYFARMMPTMATTTQPAKGIISVEVKKFVFFLLSFLFVLFSFPTRCAYDMPKMRYIYTISDSSANLRIFPEPAKISLAFFAVPSRLRSLWR